MSDPRVPMELRYESARDEPVGRRPVWVWALVVLYLLIVAPLILLFPAWVASVDPGNRELLLWASGTALVMTVAAMGLLLIPIRAGRRRPFTRRSVWIPIAAAGLLVGLLVVGAGLVLIEYIRHEHAGDWFVGVWIGGGAVWIAWSVLLWLLTGFRDPTSVVVTLHRWVLAGSVAELLVAVPTHLVVRKRTYCCAGFYTGTGIAFGVIVMVIAFGPSVAFLFYKRWKKVQPPKPADGMTNDESMAKSE